jgi:murein tripeptide amidase MpaA
MDMQQEYAYEPSEFSEGAVINTASAQVAFGFDCLSVTLEMPFKDCWSNPHPERGWSPARSRALGASALQPLMYIHPYLRAEGEFWKTLPGQDAYVLPTSKYK